MGQSSRQQLLEMYASGSDRLRKRDSFPVILIVSLVLFILGGWYLHKHIPPAKSLEEKISQITTRFIVEEKPAKVEAIVKEKKKEPEPPKPKEEKPKEPIDLTQKPVMNQPKNDIIEKPPQNEPPKDEPRVVRRVYGLQKVYSTGIGSGGNASDAVIGKLGNTLNTEIDTFKATKEELKGQLVSITTVTTNPRAKVQVKPEYTKEMLENKIEGVIRAKILIDVDGKVKQVIVLDDLGYGSKQKVYEACLKLEFEPAMANNTPVAVWFPIRIRFEMLKN